MPSTTQEGKQRVAEGTGRICQLPIWGPCRGDRTVNHGYLQTEPEATSQAPQVTQVHSQSPCCLLEVGWNSRTQTLQRTDVSLDGNPCCGLASRPLRVDRPGLYKPAGAGLGTGLGVGLPARLQGSESLGETLRAPGRRSSSGRKPGCRRACLVRWSLRVKRLVHRGQGNRFSPVCVRWWRASSSDRANFLSHPGQSQAKGRSPV